MKASLASFTSLELASARADADLLIGKLRAGRILNKVSKILSQEVTDCFKVIVHVDMDMFYAAVEMRDQPELVDKPMAVGGMGMLSTSNYKVRKKKKINYVIGKSFQARRFGVRAAMPGFIAKKLCPQLVIVPPNMDKYAAVAEQVRFFYHFPFENL